MEELKKNFIKSLRRLVLVEHLLFMQKNNPTSCYNILKLGAKTCVTIYLN